MVDLVNIGLRTLMCLAFLIWVVRPMLMALVYREPRTQELEDVAETAVHNAFNAWRLQQGPKYYDNPEHALLALQQPELLNPPPDAPVATEAPEAAASPAEEVTPTATTVEAVAPEATPAEAAPAANLATTAVAVPDAGASGSSAVALAGAEPEEETLEQMRDRIKREQKKSKPTIPAELLENANSYEDKLMVLRMIVDQDKGRVASALRRMVVTD
jgi:hypothetical protein